MKRVAFGFAVAVMLAASAAMSAAPGGKQDFTLINKTCLVIDEFYVSPTTTNDWEEDVLGVDVLPNNQSVHISFDRSETSCDWDFKIVDEDGKAVVWADIDLCKAEEITLFYNNGTPTAAVR